MERIDLTKKNADIIKTYQDLKHKGKFDSIIEKYRDPATQYAVYVLEEQVLSCEMIKLDSFRHLQDLRRIDEDNEFEYTYDLDKVRAILNFSKLVPDVSVGTPLPLMLWQQSMLAKMQGWRDKQGNKRYTKVIFSVARTNGKTYLSNILSSYAFLVEADGLYNQDLCYVANTVVQAKKGFSYLKTTFDALGKIPAFKRLFKERAIDVLDDKIIARKSQNKLLRMSQEAGRFDAYHFLSAVADEVGDNKQMGKIKINNGQVTSGQVQTANHAFLQISTAYPDSNSYLYSDEQMLREAMKQDYSRNLDNYLCIVYEQDSFDETEYPKTWLKSNPILDLEGKTETMLKSLIEERDTKMADGSLREFQNKSLNMWLQVTENTYLDLEDVEKAVVSEPPINIKGRDVYIGFDKSKSGDTSAMSFVFPYKDGDKQKWYIYQHSWIPLAQAQNNISIKEKQDGVSYSKAEKLGFADIAHNEYGYISDDEILQYLQDFVEDNQLNVLYFNYDAWSNDMFIKSLENNETYNMMAVRQGTKSLDAPTDLFRRLMHTGCITYLNDELIKHSLKNAVLVYDNNGMKVDKDKYTKRIDIVDSIINVFYSAQYFETGISLEKDNSKSVFGNWNSDQINDYFSSDFSF